MSQAVGSSGKYKYITSIDSPCYNGSAAIKAIVVHHWGVDGSTWDGVVNSCCTPSRQASAHYVLDAGKVACLIDPGRRAWHVAKNEYQRVMPGVWDVNVNTIGIECNPYATDAMIDTLVQLIADLWMDYGKVPVYGHKDFMSTQCPGRYYSKLDSIVKRAEDIYYGTNEQEEEDMPQLTEAEARWVKEQYANSKKTAASEWAAKDLEEAIAAGITTGERPQDKLSREEGAIMVLRAVKSMESK